MFVKPLLLAVIMIQVVGIPLPLAVHGRPGPEGVLNSCKAIG